MPSRMTMPRPELTREMQWLRAGDSRVLVVNDPRRPAPLVPSGRPRRAIVVDDDPAVRRAMSRRLRPELDLYVCVSVREAKEVLTKIDRIDLAFVDLNLPDGSGEEVLRLVAQWPDAICVLMSGSLSAGAAETDSPLENRALANLVLAKPIASHVIDALKKAVLELAKD